MVHGEVQPDEATKVRRLMSEAVDRDLLSVSPTTPASEHVNGWVASLPSCRLAQLALYATSSATCSAPCSHAKVLVASDATDVIDMLADALQDAGSRS